ncbi:MAG: InlB B-repeat-containing protein [Oscillospiraceae bacterium]|nr:InlB B-repeat-containing protein [Oscillospiraceae bacterium]
MISIRKIISFLLSAVILLSIFPCIALPSGNAAGNTFFVSATGSDETGTGAEAFPFDTIEKAYQSTVSGDVIVLLSNIAQSRYVNIWHDLTIKSKDGEGPYTVTRQAGFETTSDTARSWYNPAMFEIHPDDGGTTVVFKNITLDDNFLHEGTSYTDQPVAPADTSGNLNRVQDGIVALYSDPSDTFACTVILEDGTTLKNFGGVNAVNLEGNSELIMKSGSIITNGNTNPNGVSFANAQAVYALAGGKLTMESGSALTGIKGANAIFTNNGTAIISGKIYNCGGTSPLRSTGISTVSLEKDGSIHDIYEAGVCALYAFGGATEYNIDGKIYNITGRGGIWISNSNSHVVRITENAEFYNIPGQAIRTDLGNHVYMSGGSMHDNGIAIYVRRQSEVEITGGEITGNNYGVYLDSDNTVARVFLKTGTAAVFNNTTSDFYIMNKANGYHTGAYMFFTEEDLANSPAIDMVKDGKTIAPSADCGDLYLGNASSGGNTALANKIQSYYQSELLATWFADPENGLRAQVTLVKNDKDVFVMAIPVSESGTVAEDAETYVYGISKTYDGDKMTVTLNVPETSETGFVYALFTASGVARVSFDSTGGSEVPPQVIQILDKDGNQITTNTADEPIPPRKTGYTFSHWTLNGAVYDFSTPVTEDITLTAEWTINKYTVTFDSNGGSEIPLQTVNYNEMAEKPSDPVYPEYLFSGWQLDGVDYDFASPVTEDITLTAKWRYVGGPPNPLYFTLSYVTNGGSEYAEESYQSQAVVLLDKAPVRNGYIFTGWYADRELKERITSVTMYGDRTVYAGWLDNGEIDLNRNDHFAYVFGYPDGLVRPEANISRSETATVIYRLLTPERRDEVFSSESSFSDVSKTYWYNKAVSSMEAGGYIKGYPDGTFRGKECITRAEFVAILVRFIGLREAECQFSDLSSSHWAYQYIATATSMGWINGFPDGTFRPNQAITRAEAMTIINRVLLRGIDESSRLGDFTNFPDNENENAWYYFEVIEAVNDHEHSGLRPCEIWLKNSVEYYYDINKYEKP